MRALIFTLLFVFLLIIPSCKHIDLSKRPESKLPICLIVNTTSWSWQEKDVQEAADIWNKRLGFRAFSLAPNCEPGDDDVALSFLVELPLWCRKISVYGCTWTRLSVNKVPVFREVVIVEDAPFSTIMHELGHLAGCHHEDFGCPCVPSLMCS